MKDVIAVTDKNNFPVQCSIVVKGDGTGTDYVFFNTNASNGRGFCWL